MSGIAKRQAARDRVSRLAVDTAAHELFGMDAKALDAKMREIERRRIAAIEQDMAGDPSFEREHKAHMARHMKERHPDTHLLGYSFCRFTSRFEVRFRLPGGLEVTLHLSDRTSGALTHIFLEHGVGFEPFREDGTVPDLLRRSNAYAQQEIADDDLDAFNAPASVDT